MKASLLCLLSLAALMPALALADAPQVYKWTDASGVIHYSDKLPAEAVADMQTFDLPSFPPQDPAEIATQQTALLAQLAALQRLQTQTDEQERVAALARQQAELTAALLALQQAQAETSPATEPLIYSTSAFVPAVYRRNLYVYHRHRDGDDRPHPPADPIKFRLREPP